MARHVELGSLMSDRQLSLHDQLSLCKMTLGREAAEYSLLIRNLSAAMQGMCGTEGKKPTKRHFCCAWVIVAHPYVQLQASREVHQLACFHGILHCDGLVAYEVPEARFYSFKPWHHMRGP